MSPLPPAIPGSALLGNTLEYMRDPARLLRRGFELFGPVFAIRMGLGYAAVLIGPDKHRFFFQESDRKLSVTDAYRWMIPIAGAMFPLTVSPAVHRRYRSIYAAPFTGERIGLYLEPMSRAVLSWLDGLENEGELELISTIERVALDAVVQAFIGRGAPDGLVSSFTDLTGWSNRALVRHIPVSLPSRLRAKRLLDRFVHEEIGRRRSRHDTSANLLQTLLEARGPDGSHLPEGVVVDLVRGLIWAGHQNTVSHVSWTLLLLLEHRAHLENTIDEIDAVLGSRPPLDLGTIRRLRRLEWALKETERLRPAVQMIGRRTVEAYEIDGFRVPAGWTTLLSPAVAHMLPDIFSAPDRFDPERFAPDRAEDRRHRFSLIGFGGGIHVCTGKRFAYTQAAVTLALLLRDMTLERADPAAPLRTQLVPYRPLPAVPLRYRRRRPGVAVQRQAS